MGLALARVFLPDHLLALGFLLVMVVPCSSMAIGYTGLSKGNMALATVIVALSFLLAVIAVPLWMTLFAGRYHVALPLRDMLWTIVEVLIAPMILGYLTRVGLVRWAGPKRFQALQPLFPAFSPLVAVPAATMPIFQILLMVLYLRSAARIRRWFAARRSVAAAAA